MEENHLSHLLPPPSAIFSVSVVNKVVNPESAELSCLKFGERKARIALAGHRNKDNENKIFCLLLNGTSVLTHSPGCSFGHLLLLPAGKWMTFLGNFNVWEVCKHKVPLLLACGVWDRFQSGFPGDLSPQKSGGWCGQCKDFIPCLLKLLSKYLKCITSSKCPTSTLLKRDYRSPEQMQTLTFHLSKIKLVTPMLHVQWQKLIVVVPSSPLPFADTAGNFRCLYSGSDTVLFHFFFTLFNMSSMSLAA